MRTLTIPFVMLAALSASATQAVTVAWTDWQSSTTTTATGQIVSGPATIGITFSTSGEALNFVQTGTGTNYWTESSPAPYTGDIVTNAPRPQR